MTIRTRKETVVFSHALVIAGFDGVLPAGEYDIEVDEELVEGLSFPVYRRVLVQIHLHRSMDHPGRSETLSIDPAEFYDALARDQTADDVATCIGTG